MKKLIAKLNFWIVGLMVSVPAFAASSSGASGELFQGNWEELCGLVKQFQGLFGLLQTLAFIGAAFTIAGWAWGYISSGKVEMEDAKKKGIGLLIGFILLLGAGVLLTFLIGFAGGPTCDAFNNMGVGGMRS